jgi:DNA modification methylase
MCGDSTDAGDVALLMDGKEARLVVTSPPYGVGKSYEKAGIEPWKKTIFAVIENITKHARIIVWNIADLFATGTQFYEPTSMYSTIKMEECGFLPMYARIWKKQGGNFAGTNPYYTVTMKPVQEYEWILCYGKKDYEKDYKPIIEYMSQQAKIARLNNAILKEITGAGFMFGHWFTTHQWAMMDEDNYTKVQNYCKKNGIKAFEKDYDEIRRQYDNLNIFGKVLSKSEESEWGQWSIWNIATVNKRTGGHPAEFPVELPWRCIKMHSRDGDIVLEPFGGSGTTLIAAEQLKRKCYMMELDPHYCDVIIARWEKLTGKKATKVK